MTDNGILYFSSAAITNSDVIEKAVNRVITRLELSGNRAGYGTWWTFREAFDTLGQQVINQAMQAASMATTQDPARRFEPDANKAQFRVVEPALRGILNCASQIGEYGYEIPLDLRKSVPSPSRMKRVYFPSVAYPVHNMVDYAVRSAFNTARAELGEDSNDVAKRAAEIHGQTNEEMYNDIRNSWYYTRAVRASKAKKWDYVLHEDLDHAEFETWRGIARQLNKDLAKMRNTRWGVSLKNNDACAQILMGLASQVYVYWRDLRNNRYLRE
jgi:hypothetical protein